jgi:hypothetical protein
MRRYALRDDQWEKVKDILPGVCCLAPDVIFIAEVLEGPPRPYKVPVRSAQLRKRSNSPYYPDLNAPTSPLAKRPDVDI